MDELKISIDLTHEEAHALKRWLDANAKNAMFGEHSLANIVRMLAAALPGAPGSQLIVAVK